MHDVKANAAHGVDLGILVWVRALRSCARYACGVGRIERNSGTNAIVGVPRLCDAGRSGVADEAGVAVGAVHLRVWRAEATNLASKSH